MSQVESCILPQRDPGEDCRNSDDSEHDQLKMAYLEAMDLSRDTKIDAERRRLAWELAWKTRNFEIELYWKRSAYFWGFQISVFAAFAVCVGLLDGYIGDAETFVILFSSALSFLALAASFLWELAEQGSKDWQNVWERHIDLLEDEFTGPIYKTYLFKPQSPQDERYLPFSVSKLNHAISSATTLFWTFTFYQWDMHYPSI